MITNDLEKEITKIEKKLEPSFISEYRHLSKEELEKRFFQINKYREEIVTAQKTDEALFTAKETVKELNAPYRESLKINKEKTRFIALLLEEREEQ